ncbi:CotH kinase family protein [uncultured Fibrobacter sp.]|uniref:CotH kinase family protein n=1 Tax=uncultured Fibrobacter sp. TaxID=261512 RepID=UPI0026171415|nr:CotH kinase family protein [uncultured Fibrobacter sp.]
MRKIDCVAALGCFALLLTGVVACSDDSTSSREDEPSIRIDTTMVIDTVTGDTTYRFDTTHSKIDTILTIDTITGDTIRKIDTVYVPADTTVHWVGNSALVITEISPVNLDWLDENGDDPGWVEIYNAGNEPANLKGYSLVENRGESRKWVFGDELIAAKSFRIVFCDKKNIPTVTAQDGNGMHARTHTNWKLEKSGGTIYLIDPFYGIRDSVNYPELQPGISWGIVDGGDWKFFAEATPEQPNNIKTAYDGMAPTFSFTGSQGGFYSNEVVLNPPSVSDGMKVRCTQDGSVPTENSPEFNSTITITENTVLRCAAYKNGLLTKDVVTNTYFIGENVNMPVVSVSVDPSFFVKYYKKTNGGTPDMDHDQMYAPNESYPNDSGELPVHVEYFADGSKSKEKAFEIDAGISLMGGWSRMECKKSVAIVMREEYQDGWLHYPLFETRKGVNDKYKAFNLRNNGNRFVSDYFADALGGAILEGSSVDYQRSRQVVVFYNGEYRGIHDMRERYNKNYVETNYGIDASSVTFLKHLSKEVTASNGTPDEYIAMLEYVAANDFSSANNEAYAYVKSIMDVGNFADYMAAEMYIHNGDWPNNNVRVWKSPDTRWKFMIYDLDHGFDWDWGVDGFSHSTNMFKWVEQGGRATGSCYTSNDKAFTGGKEHCFHVLYARLIKNPDFRRLFINRSAVMLQNYLNANVVEKVRAEMAKSIDATEAERDLEKNGQKERGYGSFSVSNSGLTTWAQDRDTEILQQYKSEFGLGEMAKVTISSSGNGAVLMEDMKLPGTTTTSTNYSGNFFAGVQMELTAVPAAGAMLDSWSGCTPVEGTPTKCIATISGDMSISAKFK